MHPLRCAEFLVGHEGLEPPRLTTIVPKTIAAANFANDPLFLS